MTAGRAALVGRRAEVELVDALLDGDHGGRPGLLLTGDPGIGRTAVLEHARAAAASRGWLVLTARGDPSGAEHPFDALAALLRRLEGAFETLPPHLAAALRVAVGLDAGRAEPRAIGTALVRLLTDAAADRPVLLALDDVHWFDRSSTAALTSLVHRLDGEPVAAVATAPAGVDLPAWHGALAVHPLRGLEGDDLVALLGEGASAVAPAVVERCGVLTAGNPLGFRALVATLTPGQRSGADPLPELPDPGPVVTGAFAAARLDRLPRGVRRALTVAAADGTGRLAVVRAALALLGSPAARDVDFDPAVAAGVVSIEGGTIAFAHPLVRAAAYHGVATASRRTAHRALAAVLDQPGDAEHRAWQLAAAADGPDEAVAEALTMVAERSLARGAVASAAGVLERAAALSTEPILAAARCTAAGELWLRAGDVGAAAAALDRALAVAGPGGAPVTAHLWAAVARRWTAGPAAAAADLRAAARAATTGIDGDALLAAAVDEDELTGAAVEPRPPLAGGGPPTGEREILRLALDRLAGAPADVMSVPALVAPLAERSPLGLDGTALAARALVLEGDLLGAYRHLSAALAGDTAAVAGARVAAELELARVEALLGRDADADERLTRVAVTAATLGLGCALDRERSTRALVALGAARFDDAIGLLAPLDLRGGYDAAAVAADHVEALVGAGRPVGAAAWRARLEAIEVVPGSVDDGLVRRAAGLAAGDRTELEDAVERLAPFPFERARTMLVVAERWPTPGVAADARQAFEAVAAPAWATRAARASAGPVGDDPASSALASLSPAELRVAVAVGAGRSNREAADELFLSVKTVDHHLQHIYRKLGIRGRSSLAVLVTRSAG